MSGNKSKIKSPVMNTGIQKTWQNGSGRQFLCGEGGGQGVRLHQPNAELNCAYQSRVFICLILRNADYFEMSIFVYNVVLDMLGLFTNFSVFFCLCTVYVS